MQAEAGWTGHRLARLQDAWSLQVIIESNIQGRLVQQSRGGRDYSQEENDSNLPGARNRASGQE